MASYIRGNPGPFTRGQGTDQHTVQALRGTLTHDPFSFSRTIYETKQRRPRPREVDRCAAHDFQRFPRLIDTGEQRGCHIVEDVEKGVVVQGGAIS